MAQHTVSSVLGVVTFLLVATAIGVLYGYLPTTALGGLTAGGMGFLAGLSFIAAAGAYLIEETGRGPRSNSFAGTVTGGMRRRRR